MPGVCRTEPRSAAIGGALRHGVAQTMAIDNRERIKFWNELRSDTRLTGSDARVANVLLFQFMNINTGRNQGYVAAIARFAGISERSVYRALSKLKGLGLLTIIPTWGRRMIAVGKRWFRPRGPSIYEWLHSFQTAKVAAQPTSSIKKMEPEPMPPYLAAAVARLGAAIARKQELENARLEAALAT